MTARAAGRRVFVTDLGGAAEALISNPRRGHILNGHLALSAFAVAANPYFGERNRVIYGGVDAARFVPAVGARDRTIVYVGRVMPHKGIDVLIRALPDGGCLRIYGRTYHHEYRAHLDSLAEGRDVSFIDSADDAEIVRAYQSARISVLPSVHWTLYGDHVPKTELFGLALVEAMACATPVICSDAGAMPEVVRNGVTGFVVPPGDVHAMRDRLNQLLTDDALWRQMSEAAAADVRTRFTWRHVAERALLAYIDLRFA